MQVLYQQQSKIETQDSTDKSSHKDNKIKNKI